jgi:hypothetical protein
VVDLFLHASAVDYRFQKFSVVLVTASPLAECWDSEMENTPTGVHKILVLLSIKKEAMNIGDGFKEIWRNYFCCCL